MSNLRQSRTAALIAAGITGLAVVYILALLLGWEEPEWAYLPRVIIHLGEFAAVAALGLSGAAGGGWLAKAGLGAAGLGSLLLAAAEVLYESSPEVGDPLFGIASTLVGIGLVLAGVAVVRAGTWIGWQRYVTLTLGVYVFIVLTPVLIASGGPPAVPSLWALMGWQILWVLIAVAVLADPAKERRSAAPVRRSPADVQPVQPTT